MVSRRWRGWLLGLLGILLLAAAGVAWLGWSSSGARWLLSSCARLLPGTLVLEGAKGRLADRLVLTGIGYRGPGERVQVRSLELRWQPLGLLRGEVWISRLRIDEIKVVTSVAAEPGPRGGGVQQPVIAWPQLQGWPLHLRARIDRLAVTGLQIRPGQTSPLELQRLKADLSWRGGTLRAKSLELVSTDGRLDGDLAVDLVRRRIEAQLQLAPSREGRLASVPGGRVQLKLREGEKAVLLRGDLQAAAAWGTEPQLQLATDLELRGNELFFPHLQLTRQGLKGKGVGSGRLVAAAAGPTFELEMQLSAVDLRPETRFPTAISGNLQGRIDSRGYAGRFNLTNRGEGWRDLAIQGRFDGGWTGIDLNGLHGRWLTGGVRGGLHIGWRDVPFLTAEVDGEGLEPARIAAGWPGALNLHLQGRMEFPAGVVLKARWQARVGPSRLRGFHLQGMIDGGYDGATLQLTRLRLHGPGFSLAASGSLAERIDIDLQVKNLGNVNAAVSGEGELQGWLRWRPQAGWAGAASGKARKVTYGRWRLASLDGNGKWLPEKKQVALDLTVERLRRGPWGAKHLQLHGAGRLDDHHLALSARWARGHADLELAGGWHDDAWWGELAALSAEDARYGRWQLRQPVTLELGSRRLAWSELVLQGDGEQQLTASGELALAPLDGGLKLAIRQFSLGWLSPWLADAELAGNADGNLALSWRKGRLVTLESDLSGAGSWSRDGQQLTVTRLATKLSWTSAGLEGNWLIDLGPHGHCRGAVQSSQPPQLALPERGKVDGTWQDFDLSLLNPWLTPLAISGHSSGKGRADWRADGALTLHLAAGGQPTLVLGETRLTLNQADLELDWDAAGLRGGIDLAWHSGSHLTASLQSNEPAHFGWPQRGTLTYEGKGIDLALVRPWLPEALHLEGTLSLGGKAAWQPGWIIDASGRAAVSGGRCSWRSGSREFFAPLQAVRLDWQWQKESLESELAVELGDRGTVQGRVRLPLPARLPIALNERGALRGGVKGQFKEEGLLGSVFPGMIQESRGGLKLELSVDGSWANPRLTGSATLTGAGAYLPTVGIRLQDAAVHLRLTGDRLVIEDLQVSSGSGVLHGNGEMSLHGLAPGPYRLALKGSDVQAVNLPELQLTVSPDLQVVGSGRKLEVSGTLEVPEALFRGRQGKAPITSSPDLVIVDATTAEERPLTVEMALKVKVHLGDHVLVQAEGIDARLTGEVLVQGSNLRELHGKGRIEVAKGTYAAYGVRLTITRGAALFAGGPVEEPVLDILALRELEEVKVGVRVAGTPRNPEVHLYSEPGMPDTDVLAYLVLGHPLGDDSKQAGLMMAAAGALLSKGDSAVLQDRLKRRLGLDVIKVESSQGSAAGSVVTVGKYLSPRLYVSFGQSVFSNTSQVGVRYEMGHHWQLESSMGEESGADLFYRITFE